MRFCSFEHGGVAGYGIATAAGVIDATGQVGSAATRLMDMLAEPGPLRALADRPIDFAWSDVTLLPPVPEPRKIIGIGVNYHAHIAETGTATPDHPMLFTRFPDSLVGHEAALVQPRASTKFDYECEFAIVIGRGGRAIAAKDALEHVAGYSCFNDGSLRDWQFHTSQVIAGKNFWHSGSFGPWIVTPDEFGAIGAQRIVTRLNGEQLQEARLDDLVFGVEALIAYISAMTPLSPGDVIATGTPGGVGLFRKPRLWMKPGDRVEVEIDGIGVLANSVIAEG